MTPITGDDVDLNGDGKIMVELAAADQHNDGNADADGGVVMTAGWSTGEQIDSGSSYGARSISEHAVYC